MIALCSELAHLTATEPRHPDWGWRGFATVRHKAVEHLPVVLPPPSPAVRPQVSAGELWS